jgi:TRAP-type mannitol/chloroaromatic compound transport system permease small subunit
MKEENRFLRAIDRTNEWVGKCVSVLILVIVALIVVRVIWRYVFNRPILWAHEMTIFVYGGYFILAGGYVLLHKAHVSVDIVYERFSPRVQAAIDLLTAPLLFFFIGLLLWESFLMALESWQMREVNPTFWAPPVYPIKTVIPISAFLFLLQGCAKFIRDVKTVITREGKEER